MSEKLCPGCPGDPNETCCKPELRVQRWRELQGSASTCDQQRADRKAINDAINVLEVLLDSNSEATPPRVLRRLGPMWWWRVRDIMHALLERSGRDLAWFYKERQAKPAPGEVLVYAYWPDGSRKLLEFAAWPHRTDLPSDAVRFDIAWPDERCDKDEPQPAPRAEATHTAWKSRRMANLPHPSDDAMRVVGFVVPKDDAPPGMASEQLEAIIGQAEPVRVPEDVMRTLQRIESAATGGLCQFTHEGARAFLTDIRDIVTAAQAQAKGGAA